MMVPFLFAAFVLATIISAFVYLVVALFKLDILWAFHTEAWGFLVFWAIQFLYYCTFARDMTIELAEGNKETGGH